MRAEMWYALQELSLQCHSSSSDSGVTARASTPHVRPWELSPTRHEEGKKALNLHYVNIAPSYQRAFEEQLTGNIHEGVNYKVRVRSL